MKHMTIFSSPPRWRTCWVFLLILGSSIMGLPTGALAQFEPNPAWIHRDPVNVSLNSVAHGLNRFIAVGDHGYWFTSPNGQTWTVRTPLSDGQLNAIHFSSGRFIAVGNGIYSSTDGVNWQRASLAYTRLALTDVTSDGVGNWMVVGRMIKSNGTLGNGLTFTSTDGVSWVRAAIGGAPTSIAFGAGAWFGAASVNSAPVQWTEVEVEPGNPPERFWQGFTPADPNAPQPTGRLIRFLNGRFILCGFNSVDDPAGAHHVFTSTDGLNWPKGTVTNQGVPANGANQPRYSVMRDLAFGGGVYVGIAAGSPSQSNETWFRADAMTSTDGVNWAFLADRTSLGTATASRALTDITHANGQFVAVGYRGTTPFRNTVVTTPDGLTWTSRSFNPSVLLPSGETVRALTTRDGVVLGVSNGGSAVISQDHGISWSWAEITSTQAARDLYGVASGGNRFVAVGSGGRAHRSADGFSWSSVQVPDAFHVWDVIHDGTRFVAVGQYRDAGNTVQRGIASRSTDGASWTTVQIPDTSRLEDVAFGNGAYVALGVTQVPSLPTVQVSADAVAWSAVTGAPALTRVAFGGGRFLGVSGGPGNPQFHVSVNGVDWTTIDATAGLFIPPFFTVESLTFLNGHFVMGGNELGNFFLNNDRWVMRSGPVRAAMTFSEHTYVATSLWTYTLPEPEPPLERPVLTWQRLGDVLRLEFPARLDYQYQLWQRPGLSLGSPWMPINSFVAQEEVEQFDVFMDLFEIEPQLYQISVEPPGTGF